MRALPLSLEILEACINKLETLPEGIGGLKNLTGLNLADNPMASLPAGLFQLTNLAKLDMAGIKVEELPEAFYQLTSLRSLRVRPYLQKRIQAEFKKRGFKCRLEEYLNVWS